MPSTATLSLLNSMKTIFVQRAAGETLFRPLTTLDPSEVGSHTYFREQPYKAPGAAGVSHDYFREQPYEALGAEGGRSGPRLFS